MKFIFLDVIYVDTVTIKKTLEMFHHTRHPCFHTSVLRCLPCLGEYGLNLVRVLSFPFCLPKSRDEIFLRGGDCHTPEKKREKENENPRRAHLSAASSLPLSVSSAPPARVARRRPSSASAPRAGHRREPCRPFTLSSPFSLSAPGPFPFPASNPSPPLHCRAARAPVAAAIRCLR
jgi:hypothetical protein